MPAQPAPPSDQDGLSNLVTRCILAFEQEGESAVESLLTANPRIAAEARAQLAALRDAGLLAPPTPDPENIGPYRIVRRLGSGAVGSVYLAMQDEPVRRQVALKVIRPGMDSREVLARFAVERQALALLDHPNVARVLDAGTTNDGRPYLCMDFVPGLPITRYCDERALGIEARLELLARVCDAVHAAHQKGILHRDLKPSNILVSDRNGAPWPTVIDFGVAKSLGPRLLDVTLLTGHGRLVGTPEYMSPEQAANEVDVDTRTDVHALGVVLFELLTGVLPFRSERLRRADPGEMLRILREEDPPLPSAVADAGDSGGEERARRRRVSAPALARLLRGELDWIVQKATEKDRNRRYGMAADLAADLRNFLGREPIVAGPRTAWYRWRKLVQRHRLEAGSLAVVLVTLLAGLVTSLSFYSDALAKAKESDASLDVALEAVERMVRAGEDRLHIVPRMDEVRRELLSEALTLHRRLAAASGEDRLQLRTVHALSGLAHVQAQLGDNEQAIASAHEARRRIDALPAAQRELAEVVATRIELTFSQSLWTRASGGSHDAADALLDDAFAGVEALLARTTPTPDQRLLAAKVLTTRSGRLNETRADVARTLLARSRELVQPLLDSAETGKPFLPQILATLGQAAIQKIDMGDVEDAKQEAEHLHQLLSAEFGRDDDLLRRARLLPTIVQLGTVWYRCEQFSRVASELEPVIATRRELIRDFPAVPAHREGLGIALVNTALAQEWQGKFAEAERNATEARDLFEQLLDEQPKSSVARERLLQSLVNLAHQPTVRARFGGAVDWTKADAAIARARELVALPDWRESEEGRLKSLRAEFARIVGVVWSLRGRVQDAVTAQREALQLYDELHRAQPDDVPTAARVVDLCENLSRTLCQLGEHEQAAPLIDRALRLQETLSDRVSSVTHAMQKRREIVETKVRITIARERFDEVLPGIDAMLALAIDPEQDWVGRDKAAALASEAAQRAPADSPWRERFAARCRTEIDVALNHGPERKRTPHAMIAVMRSNTLNTLVDLELALGNHTAAAAAQAEVADGYRVAFDGRRNERNRARVADAYTRLVALHGSAGDATAAAAVQRQLEELPAADQ